MMDAKEYLLKVERICDSIKTDYCDTCPLQMYDCGYGRTEEDIDESIKIVENYKLEES